MRTINSFRNSITSFIFLMANACLGLIAMRIYINSFSSELNGLLATLANVTSYLNVVESGLTAAIIFLYYKPLAKKDETAVAGLYRGSKKILNKIAIIQGSLLIGGAFLFPFIIRENPFDYSFVVIAFFLIASAIILENYLINPMALLLNADQKSYVFVIINNTIRISLRAVGLVYLYFGGSIFIFLTYTYISLFLAAWLLHRYKNIHYSYLAKGSEADISALKMTKDVIVHKLAALVVYNTDTIIIAAFLSLKDASVFAVYAALYNIFLKNSLYTIYNAITPSLGNLFAGDTKEAYRIISVFETLVFITASAAFIILFYLQFPVIAFISKPDYADYSLGVLFLLMCYLDIIRTPALVITSATGLFRETRIAPVVEATINLVLSLILVQYMGIYGVVLATVITYCIYLAVYYPMVYRISGFPVGKVFMKIGVNILPVLLVIAMKFVLPAGSSLYSFVFSGTAVVTIILIVYILINYLFFRPDLTGVLRLVKERAFTFMNNSRV